MLKMHKKMENNLAFSTKQELTKYDSCRIMYPLFWGGAEMELTKSEMEIMDVFWAAQAPMSRSDLLEKSTEKTWKDSSVHILLNGMLQKGVIYEAGVVKRNKTFGRTFAATMSREEYFAQTVFSHRNKPDVVGLFSALWSREDITAQQRKEIRELISK